jgi:hypothetical protein
MRREDVPGPLSVLAFEFFFWFSRFEFALKENGYLVSHSVGERAMPGWNDFTEKWRSEFVPSQEAEFLLTAPPQRQIIGDRGTLEWKTVGLDDCKSDLEKVVRLLKTVRNNLFHGGKHGGADWDDPRRTSRLLEAGTSVLDQLAELAQIGADYKQYY